MRTPLIIRLAGYPPMSRADPADLATVDLMRVTGLGLHKDLGVRLGLRAHIRIRLYYFGAYVVGFSGAPTK